MKELPEAILVWIFQRDLEEYVAMTLFLNLLYATINKYKNKKARDRMELAATNWLNRRN